MQKKNILIAILCVTVLLLVPLSNVSGASVGGLNTKKEVIEEAYPNSEVIDISKFIEEFQIQEDLDITPDDFTLEDLRDFVIKINLLFGHYPEVAESCKNIIEILDTPYPKLCNLFITLFLVWGVFGAEVINVLKAFGIYETPIGQAIWLLMAAILIWLLVGTLCFCYDEEELVNDFDLNELTSIENSNQCPCMYE